MNKSATACLVGAAVVLGVTGARAEPSAAEPKRRLAPFEAAEAARRARTERIAGIVLTSIGGVGIAAGTSALALTVENQHSVDPNMYTPGVGGSLAILIPSGTMFLVGIPLLIDGIVSRPSSEDVAKTSRPSALLVGPRQVALRWSF